MRLLQLRRKNLLPVIASLVSPWLNATNVAMNHAVGAQIIRKHGLFASECGFVATSLVCAREK